MRPNYVGGSTLLVMAVLVSAAALMAVWGLPRATDCRGFTIGSVLQLGGCAER